MPSSRVRKTVSGTGVFMLSVFVAAVVIHFNDWMKGHSWAVAVAMYASLSMAVICFLIWFFTKDDRTDALSSILPSIEQKVNASANASSGDIHFAPVINVGNVGVAEPTSVLTPKITTPSPEAKKKALPNLQLSFTYGSVSLEDGQFDFAEGGDKCISVRVFNRPASEMEEALVARNIVASVRLTYGSIDASVESAYWIGHGANQIDLRPGAYADVLFAIPNEWSLSMFQNQNLLSRNIREWNALVYEPECVPFPFPRPAEIEGEIFIISRENQVRHFTLAHRRLIISMGAALSPLPTLNVRWAEGNSNIENPTKLSELISPSVANSIDTTCTIDFQYLPISPLERGWNRAYKQDAVVEFSTDQEIQGSLRVEVKASELAIDHAVPPSARFSDRLCFTAKLSSTTMIFTRLEVTTKDGSERKPVWIKYYPDRMERATRTPGNWHDPATQIPEQTVWLPFKTMANGIMQYDIDLHKAVELALGNQGWVYNAALTVRLRGDLSISPIVFSLKKH